MDGKLQTFLVLCETMNYRETAERMHLTQPAVTRQIQALEEEYGVRLFSYNRHVLRKTEGCRILEQYAHTMQYNEQKLLDALGQKRRKTLRVGATKTIGEYLLYDRLCRVLEQTEDDLRLTIDNTEQLLYLLERNELDFALVEGIFQKEKYDWRLIRMEAFWGICPPRHPLCGRRVSLEELLGETVIVREPGSGTRNIFEREMAAAGYGFSAFARCITVSSFSLICRLVAEGYGISFVYEAVAEQEKGVGRFLVEGWAGRHALHAVWLRGTDAGETAEQFLEESLEKPESRRFKHTGK